MPLLLSFCIPFAVTLLIFFIGGLWPVGDKQVLAHDWFKVEVPAGESRSISHGVNVSAPAELGLSPVAP